MKSNVEYRSWARQSYWNLVNRLRADVWKIYGSERYSGEKLCLCYAGSEPNRNYLVDLLFSGEREEQSLGRTWIWNVHRLARSSDLGSDAVVVETRDSDHKIIRRRNSFFIPCWVTGNVSIPISITNRSAKEDRRRVVKNKLTYSITKDSASVRRFYEDMYLPFVKKQHGDRVFIADFEEIKQKLSEGACELMLILDQGEAIAGQLIVRETGGPRLWSFGLRNGDLSYFKKRVLAASFLFSSDYLSKQGFKTMKLGETRTFLNDGVLQYKMKWGMELTSSSQKGYLLDLLTPSAGLFSFLSANPFFCIEKKALSFVGFVMNGSTSNQTQIASALENARRLGIVKSRLYSCSEHPVDAVKDNIVSAWSARDLFV